MKKLPQNKIEDTADAWEIDGPLGNDEAFAAGAPVDHQPKAIDEALGLQPISIRLHRELLENLKALAKINGIGYQPLIRQVLTRFVECELKSLLADKLQREAAQRALAEHAEGADPSPGQKRAA